MSLWAWIGVFVGLIIAAAVVISAAVSQVRRSAHELDGELRRLRETTAPLERALVELQRVTDDEQARRRVLEDALSGEEIEAAQHRRIVAARLARMRYRRGGRVLRHTVRPTGQTGEAEPYTESVHEHGSLNR